MHLSTDAIVGIVLISIGVLCLIILFISMVKQENRMTPEQHALAAVRHKIWRTDYIRRGNGLKMPDAVSAELEV